MTLAADPAEMGLDRRSAALLEAGVTLAGDDGRERLAGLDEDLEVLGATVGIGEQMGFSNVFALVVWEHDALERIESGLGDVVGVEPAVAVNERDATACGETPVRFNHRLHRTRRNAGNEVFGVGTLNRSTEVTDDAIVRRHAARNDEA